ncbi:hypothetical protein MP638_007274 [Amoeboaphelidium occidentale]|nr:hypothetical protein MP638_007274 [Amoeboaphelidium occidentale]
MTFDIFSLMPRILSSQLELYSSTSTSTSTSEVKERQVRLVGRIISMNPNFITLECDGLNKVQLKRTNNNSNAAVLGEGMIVECICSISTPNQTVTEHLILPLTSSNGKEFDLQAYEKTMKLSQHYPNIF